MASAHVIEVGDIAAGIVIFEQDGFRFFAAGRPFYALEGAVFRTVDQATRAARERVRRKKDAKPDQTFGWKGEPPAEGPTMLTRR